MNYTKLMFTLLVVLLAAFRCSAVQDEITTEKATAQIQQIEIKPETAFFFCLSRPRLYPKLYPVNSIILSHAAKAPVTRFSKTHDFSCFLYLTRLKRASGAPHNALYPPFAVLIPRFIFGIA